MELLNATYNYKDIMNIIGCKQTKAYELINKCNKQFKKEYPNAIIIGSLVPKWYFNARVLGIEERSEDKNEKNN